MRRSSAAPFTESSARIEIGSTNSRIARVWMKAQTRKNASLSATVIATKSGRFASSVARGIDSQSTAKPNTYTSAAAEMSQGRMCRHTRVLLAGTLAA